MAKQLYCHKEDYFKLLSESVMCMESNLLTAKHRNTLLLASFIAFPLIDNIRGTYYGISACMIIFILHYALYFASLNVLGLLALRNPCIMKETSDCMSSDTRKGLISKMFMVTINIQKRALYVTLNILKKGIEMNFRNPLKVGIDCVLMAIFILISLDITGNFDQQGIVNVSTAIVFIFIVTTTHSMYILHGEVKHKHFKAEHDNTSYLANAGKTKNDTQTAKYHKYDIIKLETTAQQNSTKSQNCGGETPVRKVGSGASMPEGGSEKIPGSESENQQEDLTRKCDGKHTQENDEPDDSMSEGGSEKIPGSESENQREDLTRKCDGKEMPSTRYKEQQDNASEITLIGKVPFAGRHLHMTEEYNYLIQSKQRNANYGTSTGDTREISKTKKGLIKLKSGDFAFEHEVDCDSGISFNYNEEIKFDKSVSSRNLKFRRLN